MPGKRISTLGQNLRLRLIVAIPVTVVLFSLSTGILLTSIFRKLYPVTHDEAFFLLLLTAAM